MTEKMLTATQNINTNGKKNQHKITKEQLISKLCCSCVRLLVHRFIFSMLLGKYLCKICCRLKYFSKFCLLGKKMIWGFRSAFEKWYYKKKHTQKPPKTAHLPYIQPTPIKIWHDKGSISGPPGKGTQIFYETIQLVWL